MEETFGKRLARLRQEQEWTQQALAEWTGLSRVAISHFEMDLTIPSERTVILFAGIFKISPLELVHDTTYPPAKAERLPLVACSFTPLEVDLRLLENDLNWLARLGSGGRLKVQRLRAEVIGKWSRRLAEWGNAPMEEREREKLTAASKKLAAAQSTLQEQPGEN